MSDVFPSLLTEAHKPDLLSGTSVLPYAGSGTGSSLETGSMPGGSGRSLDAVPFPGGITTDTNRQLDTVQARSAATDQLAARMVSSVPPSNTETAIGKAAAPAGSAVASLPWMNLPGATGSNADPATGLPKLQFISHENALLTGASRNESVYNGVPRLDENGLEVTQPSSPNKHPGNLVHLQSTHPPSQRHTITQFTVMLLTRAWGHGAREVPGA
ncbi:hypothetical protein [Asaia sp. HN010]|uniref:hypothetical protein n=1 Tax=Asaia sp. HN010 TaxID=3081233 RepID=UPI0030184A8B